MKNTCLLRIILFLSIMTAAWINSEGNPIPLPFFTGTVFPPPQTAHYFNRFIPLENAVVILGEDIDKHDARVELLVERIRQCGGKATIAQDTSSPEQTLILIGKTHLYSEFIATTNLPSHPEAYCLHCVEDGNRHIVFLRGYDFYGLLWAVTAFNQLITHKNDKPVLRAATIIDYPDVPAKRNYSPFNDDELLTLTHFAISALRPNRLQYRMAYKLGRCGNDWRAWIVDKKQFEAWQAQIRAIGAFLAPFKIMWSDAIQPLAYPHHTSGPGQIRSKSEEDFSLLLKVAQTLAEAGGDLMLMYDDFRFPLHPDDLRDFGSAREADIFLVERLYKTVAEKHPQFKIIWCPPFYWGPLSDASAIYGEARDEYLAAAGTRLPQAIEIFWTGPRVKSEKVASADLAWISGLIRRKPVYWQNAVGHCHGGMFFVYPTDEITAWRDWYPPEFFEQISWMTFNDSNVYVSLTLLAAMWNRQAYEPASIGRAAVEKLVGPDAYSNVVEICRQLEALEQYGWTTPTAAAAKNIEEVRAHTEMLEKSFAAAPLAVRGALLGLNLYVDLRKKYLADLVKHPDLQEILAADKTVREIARRENDLPPGIQDLIILTPSDFKVNRPPKYYAWRTLPRRYVVWINGVRSRVPRMSANFSLTAPPTSDFDLILSGLDHNAESPCRIRITVNGHMVFEGPNPFASMEWRTYKFRVNGQFLRDNTNVLLIENIEDSDNMSGPPWFMLNYAILQPRVN